MWVNDQTRISHMLAASRQAATFVIGRSRADLDADAMLGLALIRLLEIVGEAARGGCPSHFALRTRRLPGAPWQECATG